MLLMKGLIDGVQEVEYGIWVRVSAGYLQKVPSTETCVTLKSKMILRIRAFPLLFG